MESWIEPHSVQPYFDITPQESCPGHLDRAGARPW